MMRALTFLFTGYGTAILVAICTSVMGLNFWAALVIFWLGGGVFSLIFAWTWWYITVRAPKAAMVPVRLEWSSTKYATQPQRTSYHSR